MPSSGFLIHPMSSVAAITREQYLQQRKEAARVSRRKIILPGILFVVPLFALTIVFGKEKPPANMGELVLFGTLAFIGFVGLVWCYVRMFLDVKMNAFACPCCGKNLGGHKASQWLIASGNCIKCGGKVFQDSLVTVKSESESLSLRADYEERLKQAESALLRQSFFVSIPLLLALIWLARQYLSPTGPESYHGGILVVIFAISAVILVVLVERVLSRSEIKCANCGSTPLRHGSVKIVLSTGCCVKCGSPMFASQPSNGGLPK